MIGRALLALALLVPAAPAAAAPAPACDAPVAGRPGHVVADPDCDPDGTPFTALPGARVHTGIRDGAAYRVEVPRRWNGRLVVYAHGYRGEGATVFVDNPALRRHYIERGFAWAASSYATNGYDPGQGVTDTHALIEVFRAVTGRPARKVYITGASMGGHVTAAAIEKYPRAFAGAMPTCGVLGDVELFDYFLDTTVTAAALTGTDITFPAPADFGARLGRILPALGVTPGRPPALTAAGRTWSDVVERRSGGERPGFDAAFAYWNTAAQGGVPFLFSFYPSLTPGSVDNRRTFYRSTDARWPTRPEWRLNADLLRVRRTTTADRIPVIAGRPRIPVLSLHGLGDLFVPFSMEQRYAREAGSRFFVSRAIRDITHCGFTQDELRQGFDDLVRWVEKGRRPAGDAILDRRAVAAASFGCRFTVGVRGSYPPC